MPILNVKISKPSTAEQRAALSRATAATLVDLTERILKKRRDLIAIAIDFIDPQDWYIAGRSLAELGRTSVYFDIKITDETNTKAEKAAYIAAAFEAFGTLLGNLHEESYIHVEDVRAAAYGYGGLTQEYRYQHPVTA